MTENENVLKIYTDNQALREWYYERIEKHNYALKHNQFPDSGFDLAIPKDMDISTGSISNKVDLEVKCVFIGKDCPYPSSPYYIYPRSSISKTPLHLANNVGIIDAGYRGNLIIMLRNLSNNVYSITKHDRLVQICHPSLLPFSVKLMNSEQELGTTQRMGNGFGSTGK